MATTPAAIRAALTTAIEALTPTSLGDALGFRAYDLELDFEEAMLAQPAHCFRKFFLEYGPPPTSPDVVNGQSGRWRYPFTLTVAYPRNKYGTALSPLAVRDVIDADHALLIPVLRDYVDAAYVAEEETTEREDVDKLITLMRIGAVFELWRNV